MLTKKFDCSLRKHSKKLLEIKMEYPLTEGRREAEFNLNFYFFFPAQLHVNEKRIGVKNVINNIQINTRFSSPLIPLDKVIDSDFDLSPLVRIENMIRTNEQIRGTSLLYELQTLCNLYRVEIRNFIYIIKKELKNKHRKEICGESILIMIGTIGDFLTRFRKLHIKFIDPHIHDDERMALNWADESISIITENGLFTLFHYCRPIFDRETLPLTISRMIEEEVKYRKLMEYRYNYDEGDKLSGENMAYRESVLKKWSQCALYMNNEHSQAPNRISHILAGTAAAFAMLFAVGATIYAENTYPRNSSLWIIIIVFTYVFKDRIKEVLRKLFGNLLPQLTTDQQSNLYDPALKQKAGKSSGTVRFCTTSNIPSTIKKIRYSKPNPFRDKLPPNDVIHYRRIVKLKSKFLRDNHKRLEAITEIIRIQIDPWLTDMNDSKDILYRIHEGERERIHGSRVYRIHLIMGLKEKRKNKSEIFYHYRIICNKSGIVRIDENKI